MAFRYGISSIIVSYNSLDNLKECVESLEGQDGVESEILIVDNASDDGTPEYLRTQTFKTILSDKNLGYGAAVNLAAKDAKGKYIFVLNSDTVIPNGSLKALYDFGESEPALGAASPVLKYPDGRIQLSARKLPMRADFLLGRGSPLFRVGITGEKEAGYITPVGNNPLEVPAISATALFIGSELFHRLGGFDERFFMYLEDIDLCHRIMNKGLKIILLPSVTVFHSWRRSSRSRPYFSSFHHYLSVWKYFQKYYGREKFRNFLLSLALIGGFIISCIMILSGRRTNQ